MMQDDEITRVLKETLENFAAAELWPSAEAIDHSGQVPAEHWQKIAELGVTAPVIGEEFLTPGQYLLVAEELGRGDPAVALGALGRAQLAVLASAAEPVSLPESLRATLADANKTTAVLLYEGFGRAPENYSATATPTDTGWTIDGLKYTVGGPARPDLAAVIARDTGDANLKAFIVEPQNASGFEVERDGAQVATCGLGGAAPVSRVRLNGVPAIAVLELNEDALLRTVSLLRLSPAAVAVGTTAKGIEYAAEYANERVSHGKPIAAHQGVSFMLVDARLSLDALRLAFEDVAAAIADDSASGAAVSELTTRICRDAYQAALQGTRDCVQVLGGHGFIKDHPVERLYRAALGIAALDCDTRRLLAVSSRIS